MNKIKNVIIASMLLIITVIIHKIIYRVFGFWDYQNAFIYWGSFLTVHIVINGIFQLFIKQNQKK